MRPQRKHAFAIVLRYQAGILQVGKKKKTGGNQ
jgi:hypothetical protein